MLQVKIDSLTSNVGTDTIFLEPVLKEYHVSAQGSGHPLIQYAAGQGFQFPRTFYETCKGGSCAGTFQADGSIATGSASVGCQSLSTGGGTGLAPGPGSGGTCVTKADYLLFVGRSPNQFWRIKSVAVSGADVVIDSRNRLRAKFTFENKDGSCLPPKSISVGDVVVEGPEADRFIDAANPWKNAFVQQ